MGIEIRKINQLLAKIQCIEENVQKMTIKCKKEIENEQNAKKNDDAEIIYFDSDEQESEMSEEEISTTKSVETALDRALSRLCARDRSLYQSKQQILGQRNLILVKLSNPSNFPNLQMMEKWKRKQRKNKNKNDSSKKRKKLKNEIECLDTDNYLKHVHLNQSNSLKMEKIKAKRSIKGSNLQNIKC